MADHTHIEWTDATWNIFTGSSVLSAGSRHKKRLAFHEAAPELKPVLMTAAKLKHAAHSRRKGQASGDEG